MMQMQSSPNGENAHVTVRTPDWWKGVIDTISINFPSINILLICSTSYNQGIIFDKYKAEDWDRAVEFTTANRFLRFSSKQ